MRNIRQACIQGVAFVLLSPRGRPRGHVPLGQRLKSGVVGKNEIVPICKGVFSPQKVLLKKSVLNI